MKRCPKCNRAYSDIIDKCPQCNVSLSSNSGGAAQNPSQQNSAQTESGNSHPQHNQMQDSQIQYNNGVVKEKEVPIRDSQKKEKAKHENKKVLIGIFVLLCVLVLGWNWYDSKGSMSISVSNYDYMSATINGTACNFELESAVLRNGNIQVTYVCYTPRGEKLYSVTLYFDDNIQTGRYSSASGNTEFKVMSGRLIAQSGKTGSILGGTVPVQEGVGSFSLNLTYRSDDWTTYEGTFSATLGRSSLSGSYGDSSMTIEDAKFNFSLQ